MEGDTLRSGRRDRRQAVLIFYMVFATAAPSEHVLLVFLCQLVALLVLARLLGRAMSTIGQPSVIGELLAGVVLGPSILGRAAPDISQWLFPEDAVQGAMLYSLAWFGLLLLLASTGFESDLNVIRRLGRPVVYVTIGSLVLPLAGGILTGAMAPDDLLGPDATRVGFAAFLAVALSISSLPVVAKVLAELGLVRRNVGQLILAVAVANDVVGWILLGLVVGLAEADGFAADDLLVTIAGVLLFVGLALSVGQQLTDRLLRSVATSSPTATSPVFVIIVLVLGAGALTQWMGVEAVLGAFLAGLVIGRSSWRDERALRLVDSLAHGLLAPLFFATAGLRIDLGVFTDPTVALWSVIIIAVASMTKLVGATIGAWASRLPRREGFALGAALNARGALEIVIASIGLSLGVLNDASYGAIVIMAVVTSVAAPPLIRLALDGWEGTEDEQQRLHAEEVARSRIVLSDRPPLLVTRGQPPSIAAAQLIELCWPSRHPVTVVTSATESELSPIRGVLHERPIRLIHRASDQIAAQTTKEADKGHSAVVLGITDRPGGPLLSPFVQDILAAASRPVILVRSERMSGQRLPQAFGRALVPVTGSINSQAALELASAMSSHLGTALSLVHIDPTPALLGRTVLERMADVADPLLQHARASAQRGGASQISTHSTTAESIPGELARLAIEFEADVVLIGTTARHVDGRMHLGPTAAYLLETCPATVVVVVTPRGWTGAH